MVEILSALTIPALANAGGLKASAAGLIQTLGYIPLSQAGGTNSTITPSGTGVRGLTVQGLTGQTAVLVEARTDAGVPVFQAGPSANPGFQITGDQQNAAIQLSSYAGTPQITGRRANATYTGTHTPILSGQSMLSLIGAGHPGVTNFVFSGTAARIQFQAAENFSATNQGTAILFETMTIGTTTLAERMRINSDGNLSLTSGRSVVNFADKNGQVCNVKAYGALGNTAYVTAAGAITTGTQTLVVTGGAFTTFDVGKSIAVAGAGAAGVPLATTIAAYTSATTVTLTASASTTVTVADVVYGTDDTAAIQAAIDATAGIIYLPPGNYLVSQIRLKTRTLLTGAGWGSQITQKGGTNGHLIILDSTSVINAGLSDFSIHGAKAVQSVANDGVHFTESTGAGDDVHTIYNLYIGSCKGDGIYLGNEVREVRVFGCYILQCDKSGIHTGVGATDSSFVQVDVGLSGLQGILLEGSTNRFTNVKSFYAGQINSALSRGFDIIANNNELTGCEGQDNETAFYIQGNRGAYANCTSDNSSGIAFVLDSSNYNAIRGQTLGFSTVTATGLINIINGSIGNIVEISFDPASVVGGNYVQGQPSGNMVRVGPSFGYRALTYTALTWTVVTATNVITTSAAHGLSINDPVVVSTGATLPAPLLVNTVYYVKTVPSTTTLTISATVGGADIDITTTGTGTHTMTWVKPDPYLAEINTLALTGATAMANPAQSHEGQRLSFQLTQDATGGRNVSWGNLYSIRDYAPSTRPNQRTTIDFAYNGSLWIQTGALVENYRLFMRQHDMVTSAAATLQTVAGIARTIVPAVASTNQKDVRGEWLRISATANNADSNIAATVFTLTRMDWDWIYQTKVQIPTTLVNMRVFIGLFGAAAVMTADTQNTINSLYFRYSTAASDTVWQCCSSNASATTVVSSGVTVAADTVYLLKIDSTDPSNIRFYINGVLVATLIATLPASTTNLAPGHYLRSLSASGQKNLDVGFTQIWQI